MTQKIQRYKREKEILKKCERDTCSKRVNCFHIHFYYKSDIIYFHIPHKSIIQQRFFQLKILTVANICILYLLFYQIKINIKVKRDGLFLSI